jgi:hypothetical protein
VLKGGDHGSSIDSADPDKSVLLKAVNYTDGEMEMPPSGKLPQAQIDVLAKWVKAGAPWPPGEGSAEVAGPPPAARRGGRPRRARPGEEPRLLGVQAARPPAGADDQGRRDGRVGEDADRRLHRDEAGGEAAQAG